MLNWITIKIGIYFFEGHLKFFGGTLLAKYNFLFECLLTKLPSNLSL